MLDRTRTADDNKSVTQASTFKKQISNNTSYVSKTRTQSTTFRAGSTLLREQNDVILDRDTIFNRLFRG